MRAWLPCVPLWVCALSACGSHEAPRIVVADRCQPVSGAQPLLSTSRRDRRALSASWPRHTASRLSDPSRIRAARRANGRARRWIATVPSNSCAPLNPARRWCSASKHAIRPTSKAPCVSRSHSCPRRIPRNSARSVPSRVPGSCSRTATGKQRSTNTWRPPGISIPSIECARRRRVTRWASWLTESSVGKTTGTGFRESRSRTLVPMRIEAWPARCIHFRRARCSSPNGSSRTNAANESSRCSTKRSTSPKRIPSARASCLGWTSCADSWSTAPATRPKRTACSRRRHPSARRCATGSAMPAPSRTALPSPKKRATTPLH